MSRGSSRKRSRTGDLGLFAGVAVIVSIVGVAAWLTVRHDDAKRPGDLADDPGVAHVHGLGINPADGALIVATHFGSFRIGAGTGEAERIGESFQDTMGFTVAGSDHFLGSGHPDLAGVRAGQPGRLGLIESKDAGRSWSPLSLGGNADFHTLALTSGQVYGWDAGTGRFMATVNRVDWETRSTLDMFGFAVDPGDGDHLVATTAAGTRVSTDGGRTWLALDGPPLVAVSWDAASGLWGTTANGELWGREGLSWLAVGQIPGEPQALLATADILYAAAQDASGVTAIYQSGDGGRTWTIRYRDPDR